MKKSNQWVRGNWSAFRTMAAVILVSTWFAANAATPTQAQGPRVRGPFVGPTITPRSFDGDLRQLPKVAPTRQPRIYPLRGRDKPAPSAFPRILPGLALPGIASTMPAPIQNFGGISFTLFGSGWPPDPNGDVGPNHYIQAVNVSFAVYDKAGTLLDGPTSFDSLWSAANTGTPCDSQNMTDPIVLYDQLADRWLIADMAFATDFFGNPLPPFYECIAVSKASDPVSGGWYLYPLLGDNNLLNDYPKFGLWPDAYYMTANMYDLTSNDVFVRVWALDRNSMVSGGPLNNVHFDLQTCLGSDSVCPYISLLPSNLRGSPPPSGSPNYLANIETANTAAGLPFSSNVIHFWKFHVDWSNQNNSTFTGPTNLTVENFGEPLVASSGSVALNLIPQKGTTTLLDTLGDRLMMQAQYRNLPAAGVQSLWLAHTVNSGNVTGIRWYEIGVSGASFSLNQQGTFDPGDGNFRWMPSLAVDNVGNMAIGYSISSSNINPGIRYAGRLRTDSPNQLAQGEATLKDGTGSQTGFPLIGPITRWGDYAAMTVDPTDDCTFWFTTEYYTSDGYSWQTRIGSLRFPTCTVVTPVADLTVAKTHAGNFMQGQVGASYTIMVTNSGAGATNGTVTVTDTLPMSLTATELSGTGWSCTTSPLACSRSDGLSAGSNYPVLTLTVNVANDAPTSVTNVVQVVGGGELNTGNDTASDPTTIMINTYRYFLPLIRR